jgi:hypothetical protein
MKINPSKNVPTKTSNDEDWINWHKALKSRYGKKDANYVFVKAYSKIGSKDANTGNLRDYLKDVGIDIEANSLLGTIRDGAYDTLDTVGDVFKVGGYVAAGIIAVPLILVSVVVWQALKNPEIIKSVRG